MGGEQVAAAEVVAEAAPVAEVTEDAHMEIDPDGSIKSEDAFGQAKADISGDDDAATDQGDTTADPQPQDRTMCQNLKMKRPTRIPREEPAEVEVDKERSRCE